MKKILAIALTVVMMASTFCFAVDAKEEPIDFYAGVKEGTDSPVMDGTVSEGEYAVAIEDLNPNDPDCEYYKYLAYSNLSGGDKEPSGKSDTISFSIYISVDDEYLYAAAIEKDYALSTDGKEDNKSITMIDFTLPSGAAFRYRLVVDGTFQGFCENIDGKKVSPGIADYGTSSVLDGDIEYTTIELRVKLSEIANIIEEDLPNTIYFAAFNRFDTADDVVFQALHDDAMTGEFAGFIACTLLRKCHTLHLNEEGKCSHRAMKKQVIDDNTHKLTCVCGYVEEGSHEWGGVGEVIKRATYTEEGLKQYTCKKCDATKDEVIPKRPPRSDMPAEDGGDQSGADNTQSRGCGASISGAGLAIIATLGFGITVLKKKN